MIISACAVLPMREFTCLLAGLLAPSCPVQLTCLSHLPAFLFAVLPASVLPHVQLT
jgi:hypothetical protein